MAMTFKDMQDAAIAYGFDDTTYRTRMKLWINRAYHLVAHQVTIDDLHGTQTLTVSTGASSAAFTLPVAKVDAVLDVTEDNYRRLRPLPWRDVRRLGRVTGLPTVYATYGTGLLLWPFTPSTISLDVAYWKDVVDMVADGDVTLLIDAFNGALVSYAVAQAYLAEDDPQMFQTHMAEYKRQVTEMAAARSPARRDGPNQVKGTWNVVLDDDGV